MTTRRDLLKTSLVGAGALALSPSLSAFAADGAGGGIPKRFVFIRKSNGTFPDFLRPTNFSEDLIKKDEEKEAFEVGLDKFELPPFLQALEPDKKHMTLLQGLSAKMANNGHEAWQSVMGLCHTMGGAINLLKRTSIDFELAHLFPSPLGHVEVSFAFGRHGIVPGYSIPAPFQKNFCYADAITAYENLFKCVLDPSELEMDNVMLAQLQQHESAQLNAMMGADKKAKENHTQSLATIRNNNKKLATMGKKVAKFLPDRDFIYDKGKPTASLIDRQDAMTEVVAGILTSGLTNVVTYTIDDLHTKQTGLPGIENVQVGLHRVGHNESFGGVAPLRIREMVRTQHIKQVRRLIDALKAVPEGNGTMFDNTMIMYFPETAEKHHSHGTESPWVIMSGANCKLDIAGRYIRLPYHMREGHQTLGNWYTTLLNAHGNPIKHYGDLDLEMERAKKPQEGAIKRFMKV